MNLSERDKRYNWHPYTQHKTAADFPAIVEGDGALLWDENGKEYKLNETTATLLVRPRVHRAPQEKNGQYRLLLIC